MPHFRNLDLAVSAGLDKCQKDFDAAAETLARAYGNAVDTLEKESASELR